jgi:ribonuclease HII
VLRFEQEAWTGGLLHVAGVDEAGRGPLAGPVVAAAVAFEKDFLEPSGQTHAASTTE